MRKAFSVVDSGARTGVVRATRPLLGASSYDRVDSLQVGVAGALARREMRSALEARREAQKVLGPLAWLVLPDLPRELTAFAEPTE
eukprot:271481-Prorocentrum_minimum.AAC.2